ncbi:MAG: ABC transporter permease [Balneolaceae bacterium]|nr:ABC transporter permease [Balneolaceae bacterium]
MKFEWYLALRYFRGNRKGSGFLSFVKYMSITGVAVGAGGLLIALSIVHGFKSTIYGKVFDFAPHITIRSISDMPLNRIDTLYTHLDQYPEIQSKQIVVQGQVMMQTRDEVTGSVLKGIEGEEAGSNIQPYINSGTFDLSKDSTGKPGILIGSDIATAINADIGDVLTVYTIEGVPSLLNSPEIQQFTLRGTYEIGMAEFDEAFAIVDASYARKLLRLSPNQASGIELTLTSPEQISAFRNKISQVLTIPFYIETVYMVFGNIFEWVNLQESMVPLVISGMIIVAAFNLIGAILMMVLERTRDIGILKTIGSKSRLIRKIFLLEGLMVAAVGLVIGIILSLLFYYLQVNYHIIPLSAENYYMSYAPVEPHALDFLIVSVITFMLCGLASLIPARIAAKTDPLKVISYGR